MTAPLPTTDAPEPAGEPAPILWARSGAMGLCGHEDGPPRAGAAAVAAHAAGWARELCARSGADVPGLDGPALLGERAAQLGLARRGRVSPGGACRLLPTAEGFLAVNLARADDFDLLPAWLEREVTREPWGVVAEAVREAPARRWVERGRLLGLAVAATETPADTLSPAAEVDPCGTAWPRRVDRPLVVDLSSLWAGPLCTQLLGLGGARVVKVESLHRPDGARRGAPAFFDLLNAGKASVALDLRSTTGRDTLLRWIEVADVVVEASRPRALRQLGIDAEAALAIRPGLVWVSITGHGRREPNAQWVAFGDDAAVAAGLASASGEPGDPVFCADAIADPLAGLRAAVETRRALDDGGGCLVDVSLSGVAREALGPIDGPPLEVVRRDGAFWVECEGARAPVMPPRARLAHGIARPFGADTESFPC